MRTNYLSLALHLLGGALALSPHDHVALNEVGVIYLRLHRLEEAVAHLAKAVEALEGSDSSGGAAAFASTGGAAPARARMSEEVLGNYATALRKSGRLGEALRCYQRCLELNPRDASTHAGVGFTLHLQRQFDGAISAYHRALAITPTFTFCSEMLGRAMIDAVTAPSSSSSSNSGGDGFNGSGGMDAEGYDGCGADADADADVEAGFFESFDEAQSQWRADDDSGAGQGARRDHDGAGAGTGTGSSAVDFVLGTADMGSLLLPPRPPAAVAASVFDSSYSYMDMGMDVDADMDVQSQLDRVAGLLPVPPSHSHGLSPRRFLSPGGEGTAGSGSGYGRHSLSLGGLDSGGAGAGAGADAYLQHSHLLDSSNASSSSTASSRFAGRLSLDSDASSTSPAAFVPTPQPRR